jgi:hypothetical protein
MQFKRFLAAGVAVAAVGLAALPAEAAKLVAIYKGKITYSISDQTFGSGSLIGLDYRAAYTFDPDRGSPLVYVPLPGYFDYVRSGYNDASPILSLKLSINGVDDVMDFGHDLSAYGNTERVGNPAAPAGALYMAGTGAQYRPSPIGGSAYDYHTASSNITAPTYIPFDMSQPWNPAPGTGTSGFLRQVQNAGRGYDQAYDIRGSVTSVRITSAAPEPAAWALMIAGFGAAGAVLRRRRAVPA